MDHEPSQDLNAPAPAVFDAAATWNLADRDLACWTRENRDLIARVAARTGTGSLGCGCDTCTDAAKFTEAVKTLLDGLP